jgi:drug/metabolite transporter (DMT)-like permease
VGGLAIADPMTPAGSPLAGVAWMLAAALAFSVNFIFVRELSGTYTVFQIVLMRYVFGMAFLAPWIVRTRPRLLPDRQLWFHVQRSALIYCALYASYYSVTVIALAESLALQFTLPVFTSLLAVAFLGERAPLHRWAAVAAGFAGAMVILRPGFAAINLGMPVAVLAAALYGASDVTTRYLSRTFSTTAIVFYGYVLQIPVAAAVAAPGWVSPPVADWPAIVAFAVAAFASQWCLTHAYGLADASLVSPVLFARLPFAAVMAWFFFGEATDLWTWAGAALIFAGTTWSARMEARLMRAAART